MAAATSSQHISKPRPLTAQCKVQDFDCGAPAVNDWLKTRALKAQEQGTARVYVVESNGVVIGFYSLSAHAVARKCVAGGWLKRNVPEQIPAILLGMLGVDADFQGQHVGSSLLRDAILRSQQASGSIGARAILVDPLTESASQFYSKYGFAPLPGTERMFLPLAKK